MWKLSFLVSSISAWEVILVLLVLHIRISGCEPGYFHHHHHDHPYYADYVPYGVPNPIPEPNFFPPPFTPFPQEQQGQLPDNNNNVRLPLQNFTNFRDIGSNFLDPAIPDIRERLLQQARARGNTNGRNEGGGRRQSVRNRNRNRNSTASNRNRIRNRIRLQDRNRNGFSTTRRPNFSGRNFPQGFQRQEEEVPFTNQQPQFPWAIPNFQWGWNNLNVLTPPPQVPQVPGVGGGTGNPTSPPDSGIDVGSPGPEDPSLEPDDEDLLYPDDDDGDDNTDYGDTSSGDTGAGVGNVEDGVDDSDNAILDERDLTTARPTSTNSTALTKDIKLPSNITKFDMTNRIPNPQAPNANNLVVRSPTNPEFNFMMTMYKTNDPNDPVAKYRRIITEIRKITQKELGY